MGDQFARGQGVLALRGIAGQQMEIKEVDLPLTLGALHMNGCTNGRHARAA
ncbi:hypothetical protein GCM10009425_47780 [Pseudomonas asuensis]|uniref:Uncharacterized protein n=1 Tax=Pseudomonas asuensis TaxID=1825787 RepID=A0ABQ2H4V4_9PSED|nr:hypothetical protein GCM10009425_47780 [Pseudomonas asuensis]